MSQAATASDLAALILVDGAIASVLEPERMSGQLPFEPRTLAAHEREAAGMTEPGVTLVYKVGAVDVYLDLGGPTATVWFTGGDAAMGLSALEAALKRRYPAATLIDDLPNPADVGMRVRIWGLQSADGAHLAELRATYPPRGVTLARREEFLARVYAMRRETGVQ